MGNNWEVIGVEDVKEIIYLRMWLGGRFRLIVGSHFQTLDCFGVDGRC